MVQSTKSKGTSKRATKSATKTAFPKGLSQPSQRALASAKYDHLEQLASVTEASLLKLHGFGPKALGKLREALHAIGLSFASAINAAPVKARTKTARGNSPSQLRLMNPKVDEFLGKQKKWQREYEELRSIAFHDPLAEDMKWGWPCYTYQGRNVVLIHGFKEYCALLFFKGALLKDPDGILIRQTQNVQSPRQIRFTSVQQIIGMESKLKATIQNAIEVEKSGLKVKLKKASDYEVPEELQTQLKKSAALKAAFYALTPGRQRAYILFISAAKQSKTREARVEKSIPRILAGKGLDD